MRRAADTPGQFEIPLPSGQAPKVNVADVERLVEVLRGRTEWMSADLLAQLLGDGWNDRKVRATARVATPGIVSFPGSPGYKLIGNCTLDEISRCIAAFRAQAADMTARSVAYHNAFHSGKYGRQ